MPTRMPSSTSSQEEFSCGDNLSPAQKSGNVQFKTKVDVQVYDLVHCKRLRLHVF